MAISLKHDKVSGVSDGGDSNKVQPSDWNAEHDLTAGANVVLGTTSAGAVGEISCTAAGRDLLDDASASDQRTTLGLGALATQAALVSDKKVITSGDKSTSSTSFVDVDDTNMAITMTTGARRVLIVVTAMGESSGGDICLDIDIDGARQGQTYGLAFATTGSSQNRNLSFSYVTNVLTAASHTFKLQFRSSAGSSFTLFASTAISPLIMSAVELPITA